MNETDQVKEKADKSCYQQGQKVSLPLREMR